MGRNLVILIALIVFVPLFVNLGLPQFTVHDRHAKIKLSTLTDNPFKDLKKWDEKRKTDSLSIMVHYNYLLALSKAMDAKLASPYQEIPSFENEEDYYYIRANSGLTASHDIGNLGLGYIALQHKKYKIAYNYLSAVADTNAPVVNYLMGNAMKGDMMHWAIAENFYKKEITKKEGLPDAYHALGMLYYSEYKRKAFLKLAESPKASAYLPAIPTREFNFKSRHFLSYLGAIITGFYRMNDLMAFLIFVAICAIWIVYFKKIDIYEPEKWKHLLIVFGMGIVMGIWAIVIRDDEKNFLKIPFVYELPWDGYRYIILNSFLDELMKLIPFFIIMRFSRLLNEPLDYIIYAGLSALGFSFITQLHYFTYLRLDIIFTHGILFPAVQMMFSMLVVYGIVLGRFQKKMRTWLSFLIWFVIVTVVHIAYDIAYPYYEGLIAFGAAFPLVWFTSIIINNTMDQTSYYTEKVKYHPGVVMQFLFYSFAGVVLLTLLVHALWVGSHFMFINNASVAVIAGIPLLLFACYMFSSFKIVPGYWASIKIDDDTVIQPAYYSVTRGSKLLIRSFHNDSVLKSLQTFSASAIRDIELDGLKGYLLMLDKPIALEGRIFKEAFIAAKQPEERIASQADIVCHFFLAPPELDTSSNNLKKDDFEFIDWVKVSPNAIQEED